MLNIELAKIGNDIRSMLKQKPNMSNDDILKNTNEKLSGIVEKIEGELSKIDKYSISLAKNLFKLHQVIQAPYREIGRVLEEYTKTSISRTFVFKLCKAGQNISINESLEHLKDIEKHYIISRCDAHIVEKKFSEVDGVVKYGSKNINKMTREELREVLGLGIKKTKKNAAITKDQHKRNISDWAILTREKVLKDLKVVDRGLANELEEILDKIESAGSKLKVV